MSPVPQIDFAFWAPRAKHDPWPLPCVHVTFGLTPRACWFLVGNGFRFRVKGIEVSMFFSNGTPSIPITNQQDKGDCEHNPYSTKVEDPFSLHMPETSEGTAAAEVHP